MENPGPRNHDAVLVLQEGNLGEFDAMCSLADLLGPELSRSAKDGLQVGNLGEADQGLD